MTALQCPVCGGVALRFAAEKFSVAYSSCDNCAALFSDDIASDVLITHNDSPEARAERPRQQVRLRRVTDQLGRRPEKMLDFGCGRGDYIAFLSEVGIDAAGIDQDTQLKLADISTQSVDAVNMVEVIEHLGDPLGILRSLRETLKPGGLIYIESSFVDFIGDPAQSGYVDPRIGHCCIHSKKSMAYLAGKLEMKLVWLNNNVAVMHKMQNQM